MNLELICYLCLLIALTIGTVVFPFSLSVFKSRRHMLRSTVGLEPLYEHGFVEDVKFSAKCVYPGKLTLPNYIFFLFMLEPKKACFLILVCVWLIVYLSIVYYT